MWQPNTKQWRIIWIVSLLLIFAWPPDAGRSLGMKLVNWLADPANTLASPPPPLPFGLDDNGDVVAAHDAEMAEYYRQYESSAFTRFRMKMKNLPDPFEPSTERQILAGIAILSALLVWRLNRK